MFDFKPFFLSEGFIPQAKPETMIAGKFLPSKLTKPRLKFGGENEELFLSFVRTITPPVDWSRVGTGTQGGGATVI